MIGETRWDRIDGVMPYRKVPRRAGAYSDAAVMQMLGLSRATFFRRLKDGSLNGPPLIEGTQRRWWTEADIEYAREQLHLRPRDAA